MLLLQNEHLCVTQPAQERRHDVPLCPSYSFSPKGNCCSDFAVIHLAVFDVSCTGFSLWF